MSKTQEFIRIRKRKRLIKRLIVGAIVSILAIVIFIFKAPIFNLKKVEIIGEKTVSEKEVQELIKGYIGGNIFSINYNDMKDKLLTNPYIKEATISKKSNNSLEIVIRESKVSYYIQDGDTYKVITNDGYYVEKLDSIEGRNLVNVVGVKDNGKGIGEKIIEDSSACMNLNSFYPILKSDLSEFRIEKLDLSNILDIKGYIGNVEIKFGDNSNLLDEYDKSGQIETKGKMNKVLNLLEQNKIEKGYIDVSFDGPAVVKIES